MLGKKLYARSVHIKPAPGLPTAASDRAQVQSCPDRF